MGSRPDEDHSVVLDPIDQQKIAADVAFSVAGPVADQFMIPPFRRHWACVGDKQQHRLFQVVHVVPPRAGQPLPIFGEPFAWKDWRGRGARLPVGVGVEGIKQVLGGGEWSG